ncbi:PREDICTED: uncharacterized protein LOC104818187 [Tarenaya hassleriana]|uniref:uncharacterized protein LOC104818187 n=1 Tax=Tarenaya hassleriana TaxID=28532 RepID=UPI00053C3034|nr:PREDICTED: uncharacterized protein LOC104818187 [Tarenaya hassleriana]
MEASSSRQSDSSNLTASAASKYLSDLPSRGLFSSTVVSSNPGGMRVYICEHDTSAPEGQQIKTNQQNILIRSLMLKKQSGESSSKVAKGAAEDRPRKRAANRAMDERTPSKRAANGTRQEGSSSRPGERDYHSLTVERLRALLKEKGLPAKGRKDELIARLKNANG